MADPHHKKQFLNLPKYPGGSKAFRLFIDENLRYPGEAAEAKITGSVIIGYDVLDNGTVQNAHVQKSLGYGCDEEALRVINLLRFEKVKNRGVRVKMATKTTINFRPPTNSINYTISYIPAASKPAEKPEENKGKSESYSYTIKF